jgi:hypothetical protein
MSSPSKKSPVPSSHVLGNKAFAAITAVEGLELSAASKRRLDALRHSSLSAEERRAEVLRAYAGLGKRR